MTKVSTSSSALQQNQKGIEVKANTDQKNQRFAGWNSWESLWYTRDRCHVQRWGQSYLSLTSPDLICWKNYSTPSVKKNNMDTGKGLILSNCLILSKHQLMMETFCPAEIGAPVVNIVIHLESVSPDGLSEKLGNTGFSSAGWALTLELAVY